MYSNQASNPHARTQAVAGAQPLVMERDEMRRALERISNEMMQRVADSCEASAAGRDELRR